LGHAEDGVHGGHRGDDGFFGRHGFFGHETGLGGFGGQVFVDFLKFLQRALR